MPAQGRDLVLKIMQRYGIPISADLVSRISYACRPTVPFDSGRVRSAIVSYLGSVRSVPLSDFLYDNSIPYEDFRAFCNPKFAAGWGILDEADLKEVISRDTTSQRVYAAFQNIPPQQMVGLIEELRANGYKDWQLRFFAGLGDAEWTQLKRELKPKEQLGDDDRLPWSQAKHEVSQLVLRQAVQSGALPSVPLIFETCQGKGFATQRYRTHGNVVAAESHPARHREAWERTKAVPLTQLCNLIQPGGVMMPKEPSSAQQVTMHLKSRGVLVDAVDVDPFGSGYDILADCFPILKSTSIIMLSLGEASKSPFGFELVADQLRVDLPALPKSKRDQFRDRVSLILAARYLKRAAAQGITLLPLVFLRAIEYHKYRLTLNGKTVPVAGVDRLYCLALKAPVSKGAQESFLRSISRDPSVGHELLWPDGLSGSFVLVDFFRDLWDSNQAALNARRLQELEKQVGNLLLFHGATARRV